MAAIVAAGHADRNSGGYRPGVLSTRLVGNVIIL
jgi:hypothetical protein